MMNEQSRTHPDGGGRLLSGVKLLVVEDEALIAMEIEEMIAALGAEVVGSFSRVTDALQALDRETVAGAILDIQLDGETTLGLVDVLLERGCPILFVTGGAPESIPETYRKLPRLSKPFNQVDLERSAKLIFGPRSARPGG
jgi:two-component SAPR family response regulator